jgi:hypothetical protein
MLNEMEFESVCKQLCKKRGTGQCAALCRTHSSNFTTKGQCPEAEYIWGFDVRYILEVAEPIIINKLLDQLSNPTPEMLSAAADALKKHIENLPIEVRKKAKDKGGIVFVSPLEKHELRFKSMLENFRCSLKFSKQI